jgi:hypothetical protein
MQIKFNPQRRDDSLAVVKQGDILIVNGTEYDFSAVPEGATLPAEAIDSDLFSGPVERVNGEIILTLTLPHGPNPSQAVAFPQPITVANDGPVELPQ